ATSASGVRLPAGDAREPRVPRRRASMAETRDLVIVGGGPAGSATAIALARLDPALARRTLLLDRAAFPRDKTCAGGLIPHTLAILGELGLELTVPSVRVDHARVDV